MGVDIRMFVLPVEPLTDQQRRQVSGNIASKVGTDWFSINRPGERDEFDSGDSHALMTVSEEDFYYEQEGLQSWQEGLLEVNTFGRYYGPGYERGNWMNIKTTAEVLEVLLPGCRIWYGGDNEETIEPFDAVKREEFHQHFLTHGHEPYRGYRGPWDTSPVETCDHCGGRPMHNTGGGGDRRFWHCDGCDLRIITAPGKRVKVPKGKDFFEATRMLDEGSL